jgi:hypothetical protein
MIRTLARIPRKTLPCTRDTAPATYKRGANLILLRSPLHTTAIMSTAFDKFDDAKKAQVFRLRDIISEKGNSAAWDAAW